MVLRQKHQIVINKIKLHCIARCTCLINDSIVITHHSINYALLVSCLSFHQQKQNDVIWIILFLFFQTLCVIFFFQFHLQREINENRNNKIDLKKYYLCNFVFFSFIEYLVTYCIIFICVKIVSILYFIINSACFLDLDTCQYFKFLDTSILQINK